MPIAEDPNYSRRCRQCFIFHAEGGIRDGFYFFDRVAVERRACRIMLRYLNGYQPVRSLPRVLAKVTGVAVESRPWFSVGDVADCFVEISADNKRPNFALQDSCQNGAELPRKI